MSDGKSVDPTFSPASAVGAAVTFCRLAAEQLKDVQNALGDDAPGDIAGCRSRLGFVVMTLKQVPKEMC